MAATAKMAFGNKLGVSYADSLTEKELFGNQIGAIVAEVAQEDLAKLPAYKLVGSVAESGFAYKDAVVT